MLRFQRTLSRTCLLLAPLCASLVAAPQGSSVAQEVGGRASITAAELRAHVEHLASDALEGREAGTPGGRLAAKYIAGVFAASGLKPVEGADDHFQRFEAQGIETENVVGFVAGSDAELTHELIVIGAHYDHLGTDPQTGAIFNGADDDASGTSVMLEVAQAFARAEPAPKRSLLFIAFGAEEKGLLGSRHYVEAPLFPLEHTKWMVNLEMMARGDEGQVTVMMLSELPDDVIDSVANSVLDAGLDVVDGERAHIRSGDQFPFFDKGIPILCFYGGDHHADYHQPTDTADKIQAPWMEQVARAVFASVEARANAE